MDDSPLVEHTQRERNIIDSRQEYDILIPLPLHFLQPDVIIARVSLLLCMVHAV